MALPNTIDGRCSNCGAGTLTLAEDQTDYSWCSYEDGEWTQTYSDQQASTADDAVRFFCPDCGTQHAVPTELTQ